jgi:hypothetical protein
MALHVVILRKLGGLGRLCTHFVAFDLGKVK